MMRSELFEEAWKQNRHVWESTKCLAQAMYLAGEQHQQSKVDELKKRLDAALKMLDQFYCGGNLDSLEKAEQALKGGSDASN